MFSPRKSNSLPLKLNTGVIILKFFNNIGVGGTFDRLHTGHQLFLDIAAHFGQYVHVGLITSNYLRKKEKKHNLMIEAFNERKKAVEQYLSHRNSNFKIIEIDTPMMDRNLASEAKLAALVVSQETCTGAIAINKLRTTQGKSKLAIVMMPNVIRIDGKLESSTKLRTEEFEKNQPQNHD